MTTKLTLKQLREQRNETQKQAAEAIGVHPVTWSEYERGKMTPSATIAQRIAEHFGTSADVIAFGNLAVA